MSSQGTITYTKVIRLLNLFKFEIQKLCFKNEYCFYYSSETSIEQTMIDQY